VVAAYRLEPVRPDQGLAARRLPGARYRLDGIDRNPDNYFAEIEQAAFAPSNIVPGIGFSPDKMLQARVFSYADAHRYRLGTHYEALPVNAPRSPAHHYHKDGPMRFFDNNATNPDADYEPNSFNAHGHAVCNGRDRKKQSKFNNLGVEYLATNQRSWV